MKNVHSGMNYSDTVLNFDNILLLKMGKNTTDTENFSQINKCNLTSTEADSKTVLNRSICLNS